MYNLLLKDLRLQKLMLLFYIGIICLHQINSASFLLTVSIIGCMYMINAHFYDGKSNSHTFINSLPYNRKMIVLSKYIGALLFTGFTAILTLAIQLFINTIVPHYGIDIGTPKAILLSFVPVMLLTSFYLPFFYRFTNKYLLAVFSLVVLIITFLWKKIQPYIDVLSFMHKLNEQFTSNEMIAYVSILTILLFIGSYFLTVKIYERTDF